MKNICHIYYCVWDEQIPSHELLRRVAACYIREAGYEAPNAPAEDLFALQEKKNTEKPEFQYLKDLHFSISHSGDYWMCAFSNAPVGLDLQKVEDGKKVERLAKRFYHPEEDAWMQRHGFSHFYQIWSAKESYLKYTGEGLGGGMETFCVIDPDTDTYAKEINGVPQHYPQFQSGYEMALTGNCQEVLLHEFVS